MWPKPHEWLNKFREFAETNVEYQYDVLEEFKVWRCFLSGLDNVPMQRIVRKFLHFKINYRRL